MDDGTSLSIALTPTVGGVPITEVGGVPVTEVAGRQSARSLHSEETASREAPGAGDPPAMLKTGA